MSNEKQMSWSLWQHATAVKYHAKLEIKGDHPAAGVYNAVGVQDTSFNEQPMDIQETAILWGISRNPKQADAIARSHKNQIQGGTLNKVEGLRVVVFHSKSGEAAPNDVHSAEVLGTKTDMRKAVAVLGYFAQIIHANILPGALEKMAGVKL